MTAIRLRESCTPLNPASPARHRSARRHAKTSSMLGVPSRASFSRLRNWQAMRALIPTGAGHRLAREAVERAVVEFELGRGAQPNRAAQALKCKRTFLTRSWKDHEGFTKDGAKN